MSGRLPQDAPEASEASAPALPAEPHWPREPFALETGELWPLVSVVLFGLGALGCLIMAWRSRSRREAPVEDPRARRRRILAGPLGDDWPAAPTDADRVAASAIFFRSCAEVRLELEPGASESLSPTELARRLRALGGQDDLAAALDASETWRYAASGDPDRGDDVEVLDRARALAPSFVTEDAE